MPTTAQETVHLQLLQQVERPGGTASRTTPLPEGTRIAILDSASTRAVRIRDHQADVLARFTRVRFDEVGSEGHTLDQYVHTRASGRAYLVVALTPGDQLFQSYVSTTDQGFVPGFDAAQTGRMSMGPVPDQWRDRYRQVLVSSFDDTIEVPSSIEPVGNEAFSPGHHHVEEGAGVDNTPQGSSWWIWLLGGTLLGVALAGGPLWWLRSKEIERADSNKYLWRNERDRRLQAEEKARQQCAADQVQISQLRQRNDELLWKLKQQHRELASSHAYTAIGHRREAYAPIVDQALAALPQRSTEEQIGDAFVGWCNRGGPLVNLAKKFEVELRQKLPDVRVEELKREGKAAGVEFRQRVEDPIEYWMIQANGREWAPAMPAYRVQLPRG
jgi:hypothetical protein